MQNLLIVDNDVSYIQNILSSISESITNLKLYNFYTCEDNKIFSCLTNHNVDIVILNIETIKILDFVSKNNMDFYKKSIIILYKNEQNVVDKKFEKYIFKYVKKDNINNLIYALRTLSYIKENNYNKTILEIKTKNILRKIGFNLRHIGTEYLIDAITYLRINNIKKIRLNDIYSYLGKKYGKSENTIKGNIRKATEYMYKHYNTNAIIDFFNYLEIVNLPTPSEIISTILEKI